jgi:hypothetical protein
MMSGCIYCDAMRPDSTLKSTLESLSMPSWRRLSRGGTLALEGKLALSQLLLEGAHHRNTIRTPVYIIFDDRLRRRIRLFDYQTRLKHEAAVLRQLDLTQSERALSVRFLRSQ